MCIVFIDIYQNLQKMKIRVNLLFLEPFNLKFLLILEAAARNCSVKKILEISQNSLENIGPVVSLFDKIDKNIYFVEHLGMAASVIYFECIGQGIQECTKQTISLHLVIRSLNS